MRWNPEAEAAAAAKRAAAAAAWEGGGASGGGGGGSVGLSPQAPARGTGKRQGGGAASSLSLGWTEEVARHEPFSAEKQAQLSARSGGGGAAAAPWLRENPAESARHGRRGVEGKDSQRSKITWQGYGKNDPVRVAGGAGETRGVGEAVVSFSVLS